MGFTTQATARAALLTCAWLAAWVSYGCTGSDSDADPFASAVQACSADSECGETLLCICGRCTRGCGSDEGCKTDPEFTPPDHPDDYACYSMQSPLLIERCDGLREGIFLGACLQMCSSDVVCASDQLCERGACVPGRRDEPRSDAGAAGEPDAR